MDQFRSHPDASPLQLSRAHGELFLAEVEATAKLGSFVWQPGQAPVWSPGFYHILGLAPDDEGVVVSTFYELVHPDDREPIHAAWSRTFAERRPASLVYRIIRRDGQLRWLEGRWTPTVAGDGTVIRVLGTVADITERQEDALRLERALWLLNETQRAAGVGSHVFDLNTKTLTWSENFFHILGVSPSSEPTLDLIIELTHPEDRPRVQAWWASIRRGETPGPLSARARRPDGATRLLETRVRRAGPHGEAICGITLDVTERTALEERLRQAAKMEAIGTLAAGIAHDFNNFLGVLALQIDGLAASVPAELRSRVAQAREGVAQCASFTRELLTFARKQAREVEELDLKAVVTKTSNLLRGALGPSIALELDVTPSPCVVRGDRVQLESVLVNLAINSRDAMPSGGKLRVRLESVSLRDGDPALDLDAPPGAYARLSVADTGHGIEPEHLSRIFEPYFTTKPAGRGTGLGLATAFGTVRQHGGFMRVDSTPTRGTMFSIYLPRAERVSELERDSQVDGARADAQRSTRRRRCLVVDDLAPLRKLAAHALREAGLDVVEAEDGAQALAIVRSAEATFDVLITDLTMPRMGGRELAAAVVALSPSTRVLFMTGFADEETMAALGASAIIAKPFDSDGLRARVIALLD